MAARLVVAIVAIHAISRPDGPGCAAPATVCSLTRTKAGETPVTIFQLELKARAPVVVIAHGFAGSQQLMQPFAETLARNGYIAVTFDFTGHGRNPVPMRGDITEGESITSELLRELGPGCRPRARGARKRRTTCRARSFDGVGYRGGVRAG